MNRTFLIALLVLVALALCACPKPATDTTVATSETPAELHDENAPDHVEHDEGAAPAEGEAVEPESPSSLVGQTAPDFTLTDLAGTEHKLADYRGKTVVLDWYNAECPAVIAYYDKPEFIKQMNDALVGKEDVVWLSIKSAGPGKEGHDVAKATTYGEKVGKTNPVLNDETGTVGKSYHAQGTPTVYVINPEGQIVYAGAFDDATGPGEVPGKTNLTLAAVEAARTGTTPAVPSTKAFG
jgi:ABC-type Fe3+-hydroxamate transport system substrate-binding protein